tara:strand:- start:2130 stop:3209 length:1080 start_codon:yes stop_codon:yes gene_type:complete
MSSFNQINNLPSADTLVDETEFVIIDKSITSGPDADSSGKTTKVTFAEISNSLKDMSETQGIKGDTGPQGPVGSPGQTGEKGARGDIGPTGQQGYSGTTGADGTLGNEGLMGNVGVTGITGDAGPTGRTGLKGNRGDIGVKGSRGDTGFIGTTGATGVIGDQGPVGESGAKGDSTKFIKGAEGVKGVKGYGRRGAVGDQGIRGNPGEVGFRGAKGFSGMDKNIVTSATDLSGATWQPDQVDQLYLDIRTEMTKQTSRILIKVKRGKYYDRFVLNKDAHAEIGMQLYDPLRNSSTPLHQYVYDNVSNVLRPMIVTVEELRKVETTSNTKKLVYDSYVSVRIFYGGEFKRIPFTTWNSDTF